MPGNTGDNTWHFKLAPDDDEEWEDEESDFSDAEEEEDADTLLAGQESAYGGPLARTSQLYENLSNLDHSEIQNRIVRVLEFMNTLGLDMATLLYFYSWNLHGVKVNGKLRYSRTALMHSDLFAQTLKNWQRPPRAHRSGMRTRAAGQALDDWALANVRERVNAEMRALAPAFTCPPDEFDEKRILSVNLEDLISATRETAPVLWSIAHTAATTPKQLKRNVYKNSDPAILMCIANFGFQRSHVRNLLQMINGIYFKASNTSAKGLDTLHLYGITQSQKTIYRKVEQIAEQSMREVKVLVQSNAWYGAHDNVNVQFLVKQERIDSQTHYDSGTAATVISIPDPSVQMPDPLAYREKWHEGVKDPIDPHFILMLDAQAVPQFRKQHLYFVLKFLIDSPAFATYEFKGDPTFARPPPIQQLPTGPEHATKQYMLGTVHMEEASLEGNEKVLAEWFKQLGLDAPELEQEFSLKKLVVWIGDQLTTCRIRGLKKLHAWDLNAHERMEGFLEHFGWFHAEIAMEQSLHSQYYLSTLSMGLKRAFDVLGRKGLSAPSVQGNFHQKLREALWHIAEAHFRDIWRIIGNIEDITELTSKSPAELLTLAKTILKSFASTKAVQDHSAKPRAEQDDVFFNSILFCRDVLTYLDLDDAMRTGDVGRINALLPRLLFRYHGGSNSKYTLELLELLQSMHREWPEDLRAFVLRYCWLVNTTGRVDAFLAIDLLQEHNIRDLKVIYLVLGSVTSWDYVKKISASIPTQRKVKDHVEAEFNHFCRGKSHTNPAKEEDIAALLKLYSKGGAHEHRPGRVLDADQRAQDIVGIGSDPIKLRKTMDRWLANRLTRRSTLEDHAPEPPLNSEVIALTDTHPIPTSIDNTVCM